ncbi:MAG: YeeE/YedE family protein [Alphaproteobacteria bacterium]|nr:YeeE/YedE family protein [Alphaproteobacteria bacterium]
MSTSYRSSGYLVTAALSGGLFGLGLYVSQMTDPMKVLRFLDVGAIASGGWDPSLAFVIGPAIIVSFIANHVSNGMTAPLFNGRFHLPDFTAIDAPLVLGAVLFGIGWGMSGICPGPAIALIAFLPENLLVFLVAMFAGSFAGTFVLKRMTRRPRHRLTEPV